MPVPTVFAQAREIIEMAEKARRKAPSQPRGRRLPVDREDVAVPDRRLMKMLPVSVVLEREHHIENVRQPPQNCIRPV